jgi:hypothetical protein
MANESSGESAGIFFSELMSMSWEKVNEEGQKNADIDKRFLNEYFIVFETLLKKVFTSIKI